MEYNGGAVVAMAGDHCVGIASDHRLGIRQLTTVAMNFGKTFQLTDKCYIGLAGLATDVQTFSELMNFKIKLFNLREERSMPTPMVKAMVGSSLYEKRFGPWLVEPVLAGLDHDNNPILSSYDFIGAATNAKDFVVAGTAGDGLCGACESFWKPNMSPDELDLCTGGRSHKFGHARTSGRTHRRTSLSPCYTRERGFRGLLQYTGSLVSRSCSRPWLSACCLERIVTASVVGVEPSRSSAPTRSSPAP